MTPKIMIAALCLGALSLLGAGRLLAFQVASPENVSAASTPAQSPSSQNGPAQNASSEGLSLGEAGRKTRNEREARERSGETPSSDAERLAKRLEDEQNEDANAPPGLKYYRTREYRLLVPWPHELESSDQLGLMFSASVLSGTNAVVLVGEPVPLRSDFAGTAMTALRMAGDRWIAELGSANRGGIEQKIGKRTAWLMQVVTNRFGRHLNGQAVFVQGSSSVIPVFCANPEDERVTNINPRYAYTQQQRAALQAQQRIADEQRATLNLCRIIFNSILLSEDAPSPLGPVSAVPAAQGAKPAPASLVQTARAEPVETRESLGTAARKLSQDKNPGEKPKIVVENAGELNKAPAGFKVHSFEYCSGSYYCHDASVFVPEQAQQTSSYGGQYEFQLNMGKDTAWFFVGPASPSGSGRAGDPDYIRWLELQTDEAQGYYKPQPGATLVSKYEGTIDGKPAVMARFTLKRDAGVVMGERGTVIVNGQQMLVACEMNQERFAELQPVCDTVIQSLHLP